MDRHILSAARCDKPETMCKALPRILLTVFALLAYACGGTDAPTELATERKSTQQDSASAEGAAQADGLPPYQLKSKNCRPPKELCILHIALENPISKAHIKSIAQHYRERNDARHLKISYYLPHQKVGKGAWARSHFTPDFDMAINGVPAGREQQLVAFDTTQGRVLGRWCYNGPRPHGLMIYQKGEQYWMERRRPDRKVTRIPLQRRAQHADGELQFQPRRERLQNRYFSVNAERELAVYDEQDRLLRQYKKIP
jgi:hypothetical protein